MFTKSRLFCLLFIGLGFTLQAQQQKNWQVLFDFDEHQITDEGASLLAEVVSFIDEVECIEVVLQGHTDWIGSLDYNQALSTRRTRAVRDHLVELGLAENLLQIAWFGEEKPQADNVSDDGRQLNRRVEVVMKYQEKPEVVQEIIEEEEEEKVEPLPSEPVIEDLRLQLDARNKAEFAYNCRGDIIISAKEGAKIRIPEGMLVDCDEVGQLSVEVQELTSKKEIIKSKVSTYSGSTLLQSAGMILVDLKREGKKVNMNGCLEVIIPGPKVEGMRPYFTSYTANPERINWRKRKGDIRYDDRLQAHIIEICGEMTGSFGVNADKPTKRQGYLVKVKNLKGQNPHLAVESASGAVTNLRMISKKEGRRRQVGYYTFPVIADESLTIIGGFDKTNMLGVTRNYQLGAEVLYRSESGKLRTKKVKRLRKRGSYYLIQDFPKLRFQKTS
ncbi:MAG: OmpA family protein [Cyanothece sp. SIO1E1]|nr:OmpA family protein [Cyanothece sp. SIO1E1]